jgi:hypothetical protein
MHVWLPGSFPMPSHFIPNTFLVHSQHLPSSFPTAVETGSGKCQEALKRITHIRLTRSTASVMWMTSWQMYWNLPFEASLVTVVSVIFTVALCDRKNYMVISNTNSQIERLA